MPAATVFKTPSDIVFNPDKTWIAAKINKDSPVLEKEGEAVRTEATLQAL